MSKLLLTLAAVLALCAAAPAQPPLTLEDAIASARAARPELAAADARLRAARAATEQAGAWPNPAGFLRLEDAPREGDAWRGAERIVGLSQSLPLGGRLGAARRAAGAVATTREHEREARRRAVESEVRAAFAAAVHARGALVLHREAADIASRLLDMIAQRLEQGDAPVSDRRRARAELGVAEAALAAAVATDEAARAALAAAMGDPSRIPTAVSGGESVAPSPGGLDDLLAGLDEAPLTLVARGRTAESEALVTAASRARIPDLDLEAGLRESPAGSSFDLGFRISLPLFDRGGAGIAAARAEAEAAAAVARAGRGRLEARLRVAHATLVAATRGAVIYGEIVVPETRAALASAEAAYAAGETGLTEVLLARRDWLEARLAHIGLVRDAGLADAELLSLI